MNPFDTDTDGTEEEMQDNISEPEGRRAKQRGAVLTTVDPDALDVDHPHEFMIETIAPMFDSSSIDVVYNYNKDLYFMMEVFQ